MPTYRLTYFDAMGRAEPSRLLFMLADVEFDDRRIQAREWVQMKPTIPWGQLPLLEVDDRSLSHCRAIERYLAKQFGFAGKDAWEEAKVDELVMGVEELLGKMQPWLDESSETAKINLLKKLIEDVIHPFLTLYEEFLEKNGSGYLVGNQVSLADLVVFHVVSFLDQKIIPRQLAKYKGLSAFLVRIQEIPRIKAWLEKRPKTEV
ncbi:unnamed protein product, partial [Mesorhabditis belari]|uniref:Glutathione S-transferase n=1 Tax=Mesorhabditis belari TaxID=2138241 RepID=A0AAF3EHD8_9BILA